MNGGAWTSLMNRYRSNTRAELEEFRARDAGWMAEARQTCGVFAAKFLADPDALTHEERRAGARAFESWRSSALHVEAMDRVLLEKEDAGMGKLIAFPHLVMVQNEVFP